MKETPESIPHRLPDLADKIAFLESPAAYPDLYGPVIYKETHMSCVFLVADFVFKLKKPVRFSFLDFSSLDARKFNCLEEVRLNRRLAPDIYLGVVPLTLEPDEKLAIDGAGEVIDWLVKMRRLPANRMLDRVIESGTLTGKEIAEVADRLTAFYKQLPPAGLSPETYVESFRHELAEIEFVLTVPEFNLPHEMVDTVIETLRGFIEQDSEILKQQVRAGHVIEGHGDLRPQHICLVDPPVIIDALEFNRSLRLLDPFDELVFLGLECEILGEAGIGDILVKRYSAATARTPPGRLLAFYATFRSALRARLALAHLLEPNPRKPKKWRPVAMRYLAIAQRNCARVRPR